MALNKFMHPRNIYKEKKPNFRALAIKYPEFRRHANQEITGKVTLNFKDPDALRTLSTVLLKEDFGLDVHIPADRLVPTIPLRLNYIHWIEDLLKTTWNDKIKGIDIGTGASCIYPLLGSRTNGWKFLATEQDEKSVTFAQKNVEQNGLQHLITIQKVAQDSGLKELLDGIGGSYDFCMCNPPFFGSQEEANGEFQREGRSEPHAAPTASATESITWGGEYCFINRLIEDSLQLQQTVKVYTTMVGKKLNLAALKDELRNHQVPKISSTEFCQGKTMRWGLAWSFDPNFTFPKSHYKEKKKKSKGPLALCIPMEVAIEFKTFCIYMIELLEELKINFVEVKQNNWILILALIVTENNWAHQRRKRRQMLRESAKADADSGSADNAASAEKSSLESPETSSAKPTELSTSESADTGSAQPDIGSANATTVSDLDQDHPSSNQTPEVTSSSSSSASNDNRTLSPEVSKTKNSESDLVPDEVSRNILETSKEEKNSSNPKKIILSSRKRKQADKDSDITNGGDRLKKGRIEADEIIDLDTNCTENPADAEKSKYNFIDLSTDSPSPGETRESELEKKCEETPCLFKCNLSLRRNTTYILLELSWLDGENRELMQQLLQYFRNKLLP